MERTHEEATEALFVGRESRHPEAAFAGQGPISTLCNELGFQPTVFYRWQKEFFENGEAAFKQKARPNHSTERNESPTSRRISRSRTRFWRSMWRQKKSFGEL
jgi:hypothetical protein